MKYDFDSPIERRGTGSMKWDLLEERFGRGDILPYWVADMDFQSPPEVLDALRRKLDHGVFGYPVVTDSLLEAVAGWERGRHGWSVDKSWITWAPGVVAGLSFAVMAFTRPGEQIILQTPVYPPFYQTVELAGRRVVKNPLARRGGRYAMDIEGLEKLVTPTCRTLILCSPHNPVMRVWEKEELEALAELAARKDLLIIADEIHQDFVFSGSRHTCFASLPEMGGRTVTFIAPSKTFNLAGLSSSAAIIPNGILRGAYNAALNRFHLARLNTLGLAAMEAAYSKCAEWCDQLVAYIEGNRDFTETFVRERLPRAVMDHPEGTYVFWLDFRGYGFNEKTLADFLVSEAGVALNSGADYGTEGAGFARLNAGTARSRLEEGLVRIADALEKRGERA